MKKDRKEYLQALLCLEEMRDSPSQEIIDRIEDATDNRPMSKEKNAALNKIRELYQDADAALDTCLGTDFVDDLEEANEMDQ